MKWKNSLYGVFMEVVRLHFLRMNYLLEKIGVHPGQQHVLFILQHKDGCSQKEIAEILKIKPATVTVMIKRMEKNSLVNRKQDEKDQRIWRIFITDKGNEFCREAEEIRNEIEKECFENFTQEEKILLKRLLMQVKSNLHERIKEEKNFNSQCLFSKKD